MEHFTDRELQLYEDAPRSKVGVLGRNIAGSVAAGMIPAALATYTVDAVTPDAPEEAKLAESSCQGAVLPLVYSFLFKRKKARLQHAGITSSGITFEKRHHFSRSRLTYMLT